MARPRPPAVAPRSQRIGLGKFLEELGLLFRCHADAGVADDELDPMTSIDHLPDAQRHLALLGEFAGVTQQIGGA
jgi:hypothetical protein